MTKKKGFDQKDSTLQNHQCPVDKEILFKSPDGKFLMYKTESGGITDVYPKNTWRSPDHPFNYSYCNFTDYYDMRDSAHEDPFDPCFRGYFCAEDMYQFCCDPEFQYLMSVELWNELFPDQPHPDEE